MKPLKHRYNAGVSRCDFRLFQFNKLCCIASCSLSLM